MGESPQASNDDNPVIIDDKSPICIPFILERLREQQQQQHSSSSSASGPGTHKKPFVIGLNGVQGVGKTTLVRALAAKLRDHEGLETLVCSLDDFYLTHADQKALAAAHPDNQLVQVRGEPGTHDVQLARAFFAALCAGERTRVPRYDKSAFGGEGDRVPEPAWETVNDVAAGQRPVQVVIFEGWCVGFKPLSAAEVEAKWRGPSRTLSRHKLEHLQLINDRLAAYDAVMTDRLFDAFIHVDAADTAWVYDWRLEQEVRLRRERGAGMTDEQVVRFVDAYYPAYELFSDQLRRGLFSDPDRPGRQLRLVVGRDRRVRETVVI